jgi:hypothetical protein
MSITSRGDPPAASTPEIGLSAASDRFYPRVAPRARLGRVCRGVGSQGWA